MAKSSVQGAFRRAQYDAGIQKKESPFIPCATPTPPTSWRPASTSKVRYYGFMNPNCGVSLDRVSTLIEMSYGFNVPVPKTDPEPWQPFPCPTCGGTLRLRSLLLPRKILVYSG